MRYRRFTHLFGELRVSKTINWLVPLITLVILGLLLEIAVRSGLVPSYILPATSEILNCFVDERESLLSGMLSTASASVAGLLLSIVLGVLVAVLLSLSNFLRIAF